MTRYATYDCLSIHHLLFSMNETGNQQPSINSPFLSLSHSIYIYIYGSGQSGWRPQLLYCTTASIHYQKPMILLPVIVLIKR